MLLKFVHNRIVNQNKKIANYASGSRTPHNFKIGNMVLLSTKNHTLEDDGGMHKLNPRFFRPFKVPEKIADITSRLELSAPMKARKLHDEIHICFLKLYHED